MDELASDRIAEFVDKPVEELVDSGVVHLARLEEVGSGVVSGACAQYESV